MERSSHTGNMMNYFIAIVSLLSFTILPSSSSSTQKEFSIAEGRPPNTFVGNLSKAFTKSNSIPKEFHVDLLTGVIRTAVTLDREQKSSYSFYLYTKYDHVNVIIKIEDVNDEDPTFSFTNRTIVISEAQPVGYELIIASLNDKDEGLNTVQNDTVRILSGNIGGVFVLKLQNYNIGKDLPYRISLVIASKLRRSLKDRYVLNITASDKGTPVRSGFLFLTVIVKDYNDCPPTFTRPVYTAVVSEFALKQTTVLNVTTTDCDFGKNAEVKYEMNYNLDKHRYFRIKQIGRVGIVQTNLPLDYEKIKKFKLGIIAKDLGMSQKSSQVNLDVNVRDENDNSPEIGDFIFSPIKEDAPINTTVASVKIHDKDSGENARLDVNLEPQDVFYIRKVSKNLYFVHLKKSLDRETRKSHRIVIKATDHGKPPRVSRNAGSFIVGDVNDHPPLFNHSIYTKDVIESEMIGSAVLSVHATDQDSVSKHTITYHIISAQEPNSSKWFGINSTSGLIYVASGLDREMYPKVILVVEARDGGIPEYSANCTVILNILNINDNNPTFSMQYYIATVPENAEPKTSVIQISASDKDLSANGNILYYFDPNSPPPRDMFSLNKSTGVISTLQRLDREKVDNYGFGVFAQDEGQLNGTAKVNVTVGDVNDNYPFFEPKFYYKSVPENITVGSPLVTLSAYDKDLGWNAAISYEVISGNHENTFLLDKSNGLITLQKNLDREKLGEYTLKFRAIDNGGLTSLEGATVKILVKDINDDPPVFMLTDYGFNAVENIIPSVFIGEVSAKSRDEGPGGIISYSIKSNDAQKVFKINNSGAIFTKDKLDHEIQAKYVFTVEAMDHGNPRLFGYVNVTVSVEDVNDNPPVWSNSYIKIYLLENRSVGDVFFKFRASDKDAGKNGEVTYNITTGPLNIFDLDPYTGKLSLSVPVDYELIKFYQLIVNASDSGRPSLTSSAIVNISIIDCNDNAPVLNQSHISVNEDQPLHTILFTFHASDKDSEENGRVWYKLETSLSANNFDLSRNGDLTLKRSLDREKRDKHDLYVVAGDYGQPFKTSPRVKFTVYVKDVNDETPTFSKKFTFITTENEKPGTVIGRVTANDGDIGLNSELEYSLVNSTGDFEIDSKTGVLQNKVRLDRDIISVYFVKVEVSDKGVPSKSSTTTVDVFVQDINDNAPKFTQSDYRVKIPENVEKKTEIVQVKAIDRDAGRNGTVVYFLNTGNTQGGVEMFQIEKNTGVIFIVASLDREIKNFFVLSVVANDKGRPPLDAISKVLVTVLDVNDHKPAFKLRNDSINVPEKLPVGGIVYRANATDPDQGPNGNITYSIIKGSGEDVFKINSISGAVILNQPLDYEKTKQYTLRIQASDNPVQGQKKSILRLYINVIDSNDNSPFFPKNPIFTSVREGVPPGTKVYSPIIARDNDSGINSRIVYSIVSQSPKAAFKIDPFKAQLTTDVEIDREDVEEFTLVVKAIDQAAVASEQLSSTVTIKIIVLDVNDCVPVFTSRRVATVMEDEPMNFTITTFTAEDKDSEEGGKVNFIITSGNDDGIFELDPLWGSLILKKPLDQEKVGNYLLEVKASDHGNPPLSTTIRFNITVHDVNDNQPQFSKDKYEATVYENEDSGTEVVLILAEDADSGPNGELFYSIPTGIANDLFVINESSGVISTVSRLDREKEQTYQLTVYVIDNYGPYYTNSTTVIIHVADKNDNVPFFSRSSFEVEIPENQPPGFVCSLVAQDIDDGVNAKLVYFIQAGNEEGVFEVNQSTGILSTLTSLDREKNAIYNLVVQVKDSGVPVLSTSVNVTVTVLDENDNAPQFGSRDKAVSIPQNSLPGTSVVQLIAVDDDESFNAVVAYSFGPGAQLPFGLDATTGLVYTLTYLNASKMGTYNLIVIASDQSGSGPLNQSINVNISVDSTTSIPLRFTKVFYEVKLIDPVEAGINVLQLQLENQHLKSGDVKYLRESGQTVLTVGATKGNVSFTTRPNSGSYMFSVRATLIYDPSNSALCFVVVTVGRASYQHPRFANLVYYATLDENTPSGTLVVKIITSTKGNVSFQLVNGNEFNAFQIDYRGKITVGNTSSLDYERTRHFELDVKGDWGNIVTNIAFAKVYITIRNVDDKAPIFRQNVFIASIPESLQDGRVVAKLYAFKFSSSPISFALVSGNKDDVFLLNSGTGELRLQKAVNRTNRKLYNLTVSVSNRRLSSESTVLVHITDINDNSPALPSSYTFNVSEKSPRGSRIGQVTAVDKDDFSILKYSFTNSKQQHGPFVIDLYNGTITLVDTLNYETAVVPNVYTFEIIVSDGLNIAKTLVSVATLDHNDNKPHFKKPSYSIQPKEVPAMQWLVQVNATDKDKGANGMITYSLKTVEEVDIDPKSGMVYSVKPLVYDPFKLFINVVITATDHGSPHLFSKVPLRIRVLRVNNNPPKFENGSYDENIREDTQIGTAVVRIKATDSDSSSGNKKITYSISRGDDSPRKFDIEERTGILRVRRKLDREKKAAYSLLILAKDDSHKPENADQITVRITIDDVNDNAPIFQPNRYYTKNRNDSKYEETTAENTKLNTLVLTVNATDEDAGLNKKVDYSISSGNDGGWFSINSQGQLWLVSSLDRDVIPIHRLSVRATDQGDPPKASEISVVIRVDDINDNSPVFIRPLHDLGVRENAPVRSPAGTVKATDSDSGPNQLIYYTLINGTGVDFFELMKQTGELITKAVFDYEKKSSYSLTIKAEDQGVPRRSSILFTVVQIRSVDEYEPKFLNETYSFVVPGNSKKGEKLGQVKAVDADGGPDGIVNYELVRPVKPFAVNISSGVIYLTEDFLDHLQSPREKRDTFGSLTNDTQQLNSYVLMIKASSGQPDSKNVSVTANMAIDYTCQRCQPTPRESEDDKPITGTVLIVIAVLGVVGVLAVCVIVICLVLTCKRKGSTKEKPVESEVIGMSESNYREKNGHTNAYIHVVSASVSNSHASASSSGRGSSDGYSEERDVGIRNTDVESLENKPYNLDSGVQVDVESGRVSRESDVEMSEAISSDVRSDKADRLVSRLESRESLHVFDDEGGREASGGVDVGNLLYAKLTEVNAEEDDQNVDRPRVFKDEGRPDYTGSLSSILGSHEELRGHYNYFYTMNQGPQYQPLSDVFSEIGRLPVQAGSKQNELNCSPNGANDLSNRTSMLSSVSSLHNQHLDAESTFSSLPMTPNFTPAITPLVTRSPSISPLTSQVVTPMVSPSQSRPSSMYLLRSRPSSSLIQLTMQQRDGLEDFDEDVNV